MSTTKNGRRKKAIERNADAALHHTDKTKRDACAIEIGKIKDKISRKGEWKYKSRKVTKGKPDGKTGGKAKGPKARKGKEE